MSLRYSPSAAAAARTAGKSAALRRRVACAAVVREAVRTEATHSVMAFDASDASTSLSASRMRADSALSASNSQMHRSCASKSKRAGDKASAFGVP